MDELLQELGKLFPNYWYFIFIYTWLLFSPFFPVFGENKKFLNWSVYSVLITIGYLLFFYTKAVDAFILIPFYTCMLPVAAASYIIGVSMGIILICLIIFHEFRVLWLILLVIAPYLLKWLFDLIANNYRCIIFLTVPLLAFIFTLAVTITFDFLVESLTKHPLEKTLTVKTDNRVWILTIGILCILIGVVGKFSQ